MDFNLSAARRDGWSDAEIVDALAQRRGFDAAKARADGYGDRDMLAILMRPPERSTGERVARAVAMPFAGVNEGIAQAAGALPDLAASGLRALGVPTSAPGAYTDAARRGLRWITGEAPAPETTTEEVLHGAGKGVADAAAMMLPGSLLARLAPAGSVAQRVAQATTAQPVMQATAGAAGGAVTEATDNPLLGMGAALAVPAARAGLSRVVQPVTPRLNAEAERLAHVAEAENIPLTTGQRTGSTALQGMEATLERLPSTAGPQAAVRATQQAAFNRSVLQRAGIDGDAATPAVLEAAQARIGGEIGAIANRTTAQVDPALAQRLQNLADEAAQFAENGIDRIVGNRVAQLQAKVQSGALPGRTARELDSAIEKQIRGTQNGDLKTYLRELRDILHDAIAAGATPDDMAAFNQARRHYANLVVVENAMGGAGVLAARGDISPAQLRAALAGSVGRRGYATGRGDLNDVVRVGEQFVKGQVPNSGTPERTLWTNLMTGGGVGGTAAIAGADPLTAAGVGVASLAVPRAVQALYNAAPVQNYLANGLPPAARAVINRVAPGAAARPDGNALLNILAAQARASAGSP